MLRTIVRIQMLVFLLPLLVVGAAVAVFVTGQPALADARDRVDARWVALRAPLADRYTKLAAAHQAFVDSGGADRDVARELEAPLRRWAHLIAASPEDADAEAEANVANELEAAGARLATNMTAFDRFRANPEVMIPLTEFQSTLPSDAVREAYNRAVRRYEKDRTTTLRRPVAATLGFDPRTLLLLG